MYIYELLTDISTKSRLRKMYSRIQQDTTWDEERNSSPRLEPNSESTPMTFHRPIARTLKPLRYFETGDEVDHLLASDVTRVIHVPSPSFCWLWRKLHVAHSRLSKWGLGLVLSFANHSFLARILA